MLKIIVVAQFLIAISLVLTFLDHEETDTYIFSKIC